MNDTTAVSTQATDEAVGIETIAHHEAGHAVMRWLVGLPATELTASETGGFCAGTGRRIRIRIKDQIRYKLAGFAVESGFGLIEIDFGRSTGHQDFDEARALIEQQRVFIDEKVYASAQATGIRWPEPKSGDEALKYWFEDTCDQLWPYVDLIEHLGNRLLWERKLSARTVAAVCREYKKRNEGTVRCRAMPISMVSRTG